MYFFSEPQINSCTIDYFSFLLQVHVQIDDIRKLTSTNIHKCHHLLSAQIFYIFLNARSLLYTTTGGGGEHI